MAQWVEYSANVHKALGSIPGTPSARHGAHACNPSAQGVEGNSGSFLAT